MAKVSFAAARIARFECEQGKAQAFLWDATAPGLGLRLTSNGARAYVFQCELQGRTLRMTIGGVAVRSIVAAQDKARELQRTIDDGCDPREVKAEATAADVAKRRSDTADALTVADVWPRYVAEGRVDGR